MTRQPAEAGEGGQDAVLIGQVEGKRAEFCLVQQAGRRQLENDGKADATGGRGRLVCGVDNDARGDRDAVRPQQRLRLVLGEPAARLPGLGWIAWWFPR
jgi:hypothetical protein